MYKNISRSLLLACAFATPFQSQAEELVYGFFDVGFARYDLALVDEAASGFSAGLGLRLYENMSLEFAYNDFGPADIRALAGVQGEYDLVGGSITANIGRIDFSGSNTLYGIVGIEFLDSDVTIQSNASISAADVDVDDDAIDAVLGFGLSLGEEGLFSKGRVQITAHSEAEILRLSLGVQIN